MKGLIVLLTVFSLCTFLYPQESQMTERPSKFKVGVLGGVDFAGASGPSVIFEGKKELTDHLNLMFSLGYTVAYQDILRTVKAYRFQDFPGFPKYLTEDYTIHEIMDRIIPFSTGLEYVFNKTKSSPYALIEGSYNIYDARFETSPITTGAGGYYGSYDAIPAAYQNTIPPVPGAGSFGLTLGAGLRFNLSGFFDLDLRYMYQFNSTITNLHRLMLGFEF